MATQSTPTGRLEGKVALITGAARGQGRSHAVAMAAEGAEIVAVDVCDEAAPVGYPTATEEDLHQTVRDVEAKGRRCLPHVGDVRSPAALDDAVSDAFERFGRLDIVVANAGISSWGRFWELDEDRWQAMIDINLTGVWRTFKAATPRMIEQGEGGSLIAISSVAGIKALPGQAHYSSAKHGLNGLVKSAAIELGEYGIRANSIHPWGVATAMVADVDVPKMLEAHPGYLRSFGAAIDEPQLAEPWEISEAVIYLASDAARLVTGIQLPVDKGATIV